MEIKNRSRSRQRIISLSCFLFLWLLWTLPSAQATLVSLDDYDRKSGGSVREQDFLDNLGYRTDRDKRRVGNVLLPITACRSCFDFWTTVG